MRTSSRCCGASLSTSRACRRAPKTSTRFSRTARPMPSARSWTACSAPRSLAKNGAATGSMWRGMRRARARTSTSLSPMPGAIATTSSRRSTRTSRMTSSCASKSPAISCRQRTTSNAPSNSSPPAFWRWGPRASTRRTRGSLRSIWPMNRSTPSRKPCSASPPHAPAATITSSIRSRKRTTTHWRAFFFPRILTTAPFSPRKIAAPRN